MRSRRVCLAIQQPTTVRIVGTKVLAEESCNFAVAAVDGSAAEHPKVKKFAPGVNPRPVRNGLFFAKLPVILIFERLRLPESVIILQEIDLTALRTTRCSRE
jgi:hypothetical protein